MNMGSITMFRMNRTRDWLDRKSPVSTTNVVRAGTMDNNKHKGPLTRHTWGVSWPRIS